MGGRRHDENPGWMESRTCSRPLNIRLQIEEVFGDNATILMLHVQDCAPDNRNAVIQEMLKVATDAFPASNDPKNPNSEC